MPQAPDWGSFLMVAMRIATTRRRALANLSPCGRVLIVISGMKLFQKLLLALAALALIGPVAASAEPRDVLDAMAYWQPTHRGSTTQLWAVGVQWRDVFVKGHSLGMDVGPASVVSNGVVPNGLDLPATETNYTWEWWYKFQLNGTMSVTPAIVYLSRPYGAPTGDGASSPDPTMGGFAGLIRAGFQF